MNADRSARWVRLWIAIYTRGLPAEVRRDRADEIESDLCCQMADVPDAGNGRGALGNEIVTRLVLGIPADVRWRFEQRSEAPAPVATEGTTLFARNVAIIAAVGGIAWAVWVISSILLGDDAWRGTIGYLVFISMAIGSVGLSLVTAAFVFGNIDRLHGIVSLLGSIGAAGGLLTFGGFYAGGLVLLPIGSTAVMWNLARLAVIRTRLALLHAATAVVGIVTGVPLLTNLITPASAGAVHWVLLGASLTLYALTWTAIGWSLRDGRWMPEEPVQNP